MKVYCGSSRERERARGRKERSIIFDFTVYVDVVYLGSSRALFSHNKGHIPFSLSFALLLSYIVLFSMLLPPFGQSAMRKEKE
jgi:hypothetical protein